MSGPSTTQGLIQFVTERDRIRRSKEAGQPRELWTKDKILGTYRFCNINRNDDPVTKWIHKNYIGAKPDHPSLWFMLVVARVFNNPETLKRIPFPSGGVWETAAKNAVRQMQVRGERVFNPAYIVSTNGKPMDKLDYVFEYIFKPMFPLVIHGRTATHTLEATPLCRDWYELLSSYNGMGAFMANQIVTDMRYSRYLPRAKTKDWGSFSSPGPGTARGLNRIFRGAPDATAPRAQMQKEVTRLQMDLQARFYGDDDYLHDTFRDPNNVTNSLCEFDKYERARLGEGKPKQVYKPAGSIQ